MANKTELTEEQLDLLLSTYAKTKTYAAAARAVGITAAIATRIIKENIKQKKEIAAVPKTYESVQPKEFPDFADLVKAINPTEDWWVSYDM